MVSLPTKQQSQRQFETNDYEMMVNGLITKLTKKKYGLIIKATSLLVSTPSRMFLVIVFSQSHCPAMS